MNKQAIQHRMAPWDAYSLGRNRLTLRLVCARGEAESCTVLHWPRLEPEKVQTQQMTLVSRDDRFDYYECTLHFCSVAYYIKYCFHVKGNDGESLYYTSTALQDDMPSDGFFEHLYTNDGDVLALPAWARSMVYYQIFVDRFDKSAAVMPQRELAAWGTQPNREQFMGGNLSGICNRLDYLDGLGAECLYLTPIFTADFNHKYATTDYFSVDPDFGDMDTLKHLVDECHQRGMRVLLDGVFNHCGVHFKPFEDVLEKQQASEYTDWFYIKKYPVSISAECYECVGDYQWMPKLNTSNAKVRAYVLKIMRYWLETAGIDGWRLDVADEVDSKVWEYAHAELKAGYPDALLLGESWGDASRLLSGNQLDTVMNYLFRDTALAFFSRGTIDATGLDARLGNLIARYHSVTTPYLYNLLDSHDTPRFLTECGGDTKKMVLAITLQMFFVGSPAIYYGDEVGLTGDNDPDCRKGMIWESESQNIVLFEWYKKLIRLRKEHRAARDGAYAAVYAKEDVFAFARMGEDEDIYVVINRSETEAGKFEMPVLGAGSYIELLSGEHSLAKPVHSDYVAYCSDWLKFQSVLSVSLPAKDVKIFLNSKFKENMKPTRRDN